MELYARHGDLVIEKLAGKLDGESSRRASLTLAGDSSGHPHRIEGEVIVFQPPAPGEHHIRVEKRAQVSHGKPDGHATIELEPGDYWIHPLRERGGAGDRAVED